MYTQVRNRSHAKHATNLSRKKVIWKSINVHIQAISLTLVTFAKNHSHKSVTLRSIGCHMMDKNPSHVPSAGSASRRRATWRHTFEIMKTMVVFALTIWDLVTATLQVTALAWTSTAMARAPQAVTAAVISQGQMRLQLAAVTVLGVLVARCCLAVRFVVRSSSIGPCWNATRKPT